MPKAAYIYIDDWLSSTDIATMSAEQYRGYDLFLKHAMKSVDGMLLNDPGELGRLTMLGTAGWSRFAERYKHLLKTSEDGRKVYNPKQLEGWQRSQSAQDRGRKGGKTAKQNGSKTDVLLDENTALGRSKTVTRLKDLKTYRPNSLEEQEREKPKENSLSRSSAHDVHATHDSGGLWLELERWWKSQSGGWKNKNLAAQQFLSRDWDDPEKFSAVEATFPVWEAAFASGYPPGHLENWIRDWAPDAKPFTKRPKAEKPAAVRPIGRRA